MLVRLFLLGGTETHDDVARALPGSSVDALIANGVLEPGVSAALDIRPHSDGAADFLVVSDLDSATRPGPVRPDHVLGIGGARALRGLGGKFGGLRTSNTSYWSTKGITGVYAPGVEFTGPVTARLTVTTDAADTDCAAETQSDSSP